MLVLFGGPAGAGKSTLARAWCAIRPRAAHVELDIVRATLVSGLANPQDGGSAQSEQYALAVRACCALARVWLDGGFDVAIDDVLEPGAFERYWRPALAGLDWRLVVVLPQLETVLERSRTREKRVREEHTRAQHAACSAWPPELRVDTSALSVEQSLAAAERVLGRPVDECVAAVDRLLARDADREPLALAAPPSTIAFRRATRADLPAIVDLARCWEAEDATIGYRADLPDELLPRLDSYFLVAIAAGEIVGYAIGAVRESEGLVVIPAGERYLEVEDLYVRSDRRGRQLGSTLLRHLLDAARADGVERALVYSSNRAWPRTARFYERAGFAMWFIRMAR
jgi:GNAT superfamily N-acetyltransferase/chloramphenicol 3-O-phosphotransferase